MKKRIRTADWLQVFKRSVKAMTRTAGALARRANKAPVALAMPAGAWLPGAVAGVVAGVVAGAGGARRFKLFRPQDMQPLERLPLLVIHGDADTVVAPANGRAAGLGLCSVAVSPVLM